VVRTAAHAEGRARRAGRRRVQNAHHTRRPEWVVAPTPTTLARSRHPFGEVTLFLIHWVLALVGQQ